MMGWLKQSVHAMLLLHSHCAKTVNVFMEAGCKRRTEDLQEFEAGLRGRFFFFLTKGGEATTVAIESSYFLFLLPEYT